LRLDNSSIEDAVIAQNVHQVIDLVQLSAESGKKTKDLNRGCQRRLSIAEEV
jgi:ABC-type multidrug transport system ATPase subunit